MNKPSGRLWQLPGFMMFLLMLFLLINGCARDGCTDEKATNYDSRATEDDGSCNYLEEGCTDPGAINYDPSAVVDDGTCTYEENSVRFVLDHVVDGVPVHLRQFLYENEAGNKYRIDRLKYYVSDLVFHRIEDDSLLRDTVIYRDIEDPATGEFVIMNVPDGHYTGISLVFGLRQENNISQSLPQTQENINMEWPEPMGGGYHFMKFEGWYIDSVQQQQPFNVHTGSLLKNGSHYDHSIYIHVPRSSFKMNKDPWTIQLVMDLNEWFETPHTYDIEEFGSAIMGNPSAQEVLQENGRDIFTTGYMFTN